MSRMRSDSRAPCFVHGNLCQDARPIHPCRVCGKGTHNITCGKSECQYEVYLRSKLPAWARKVIAGRYV